MKVCYFEGCYRVATRKGLCQTHREQQLKGKDLTPIRLRVQKICEFPGCGRKNNAGGLCSSHCWQKKMGRDLTPINPKGKICSFDGCDKKHAAGGFCNNHYESQRLGKDLSPINGLHYNTEFCANDGCNNLRQLGAVNRKFCKQCHSLMDRHGLTLVDARKMWAEQGCVCANCGTEGPVEYSPCHEWPIDHDHSCCPGRGCGKCIRGIVCHQCNTGPLTGHMTREVWEATGRYLGYV